MARRYSGMEYRGYHLDQVISSSDERIRSLEMDPADARGALALRVYNSGGGRFDWAD